MSYEPVQRRLQFVLEKYGKRTQGDITLSFFSMANETFSFESEDGRYFLKNCLKNNSPELLQLEVDLSNHLRFHGMPTPEVIPDKQGNGIVHYRDQLYLMTRYFAGDTPTWNDTLEPWHLRETMRGMARFHTAAASFDPTRDSNRIKCFELDRISDWLDSLEYQLELSRERDVARGMLVLVPRLRSLLEQLRPDIPSLLEACPIQMIHGDFHCFNAFYRDQKLVGCCDFDFIRRDLRLFDVYWGLRIFIYNLYMKREYGEAMWAPDFKPDPAIQQRIFDAAIAEAVNSYREQAELPQSELRYLPTIVRLLPLTVMQFFDLANSDEECAEHLEWFTWKLDYLDSTCHLLECAIGALDG